MFANVLTSWRPGIGIRAARTGVVFGLSLMVVACASVAIVHVLSMRAFRTQLIENIAVIAAAAASQVDSATHDSLISPSQQGSAEFERVATPLRRMLAAAPGIKYIYTYRVDGGEVRFGVDCTPPGDTDGDGVDDQAKIGEVYDDPDAEMLEVARTGEVCVSPEPHRDQWGTFVSGYAPVKRSDGSVACYVGVDVTAEEFERQMSRMEATAILAGIPAGLLSLLVGLLIFRVSLTSLRGLEALRHADAESRATSMRISAMNVELELALDAAKAGERAKAAFVSNISHEIRTPMTAILGYIDLLSEEGQSEQDRLTHLATIRRAGEHLLSVISDILDYSKIEAGKLTIERVAMSPDVVARDAVRMLGAKAAEKGLSLTLESDSNMPAMVTGDPTRLMQILVNLIGNAVKFTDRGRVSVRSTHDGSRWRVEVEDTGVGIRKEEIPKLFSAFSQADASTTRKFGGTGLGLAISRRLAEAMGGTLTVRSEEGVGTTFTVEVPSPPLAGSTGVSRSLGASSLSGLRVLLAEDCADNQRLIRHHLTRAGAEVVVVGDGRAAVECGMSVGADVVLMDMQMPVMDGYDATRQLREAGYAGPIVALTANDTDEDRARSLAAGCNELASKPLRVAELISLIRRMAGSLSARIGDVDTSVDRGGFVVGGDGVGAG